MFINKWHLKNHLFLVKLWLFLILNYVNYGIKYEKFVSKSNEFINLLMFVKTYLTLSIFDIFYTMINVNKWINSIKIWISLGYNKFDVC